ncbi:MAG TPA: DUF4198 domain-containing protein [Stellaceae bacterium]|nr:DUF4198 domain-containing protein [Stellaceae bacterium]
MPAAAVDLFARHTVTVQFSTADGKPLANAEVSVFAPGQSAHPAFTGHTNSDGKFDFTADADGFWSAEARAGGEINRISIRVADDEKKELISPYWLVGGLFILLMLAVAYRMARARMRRR